jgi:DNA-binding response OmpR family regulator
LHILLAEDDKNFGIVLKNELEGETYTVDLVNDGVEAVLNFIEKSYDFVLIDIKMPKLDGVSTLKIIKKLKRTVPAIVFSGNAGFSEIEETLTVGAIRYFQKPFEMADLKECIKRNLDLQTKFMNKKV